jgi:hypothetical protein
MRASALTKGTVLIQSFSEERIYSLSVEPGTEISATGLPDFLLADVIILVEASEQADDEAGAENETVETYKVPVTWESMDYNAEISGTYTFSAVLDTGFIYESEMPCVEVEVLSGEEAVIILIEAAETEPPEDGEATTIEVTPEPNDATEELVTTAELSQPNATVMPEETPLPEETVLPEAVMITTTASEVNISEFIHEPLVFEVARGTAAEDIPLPQTLLAINSNGEQIDVPVAWAFNPQSANGQSEDSTDFSAVSRFGYGPWEFVATIINPTEEEQLNPDIDYEMPVETETQTDGGSESDRCVYTYAGEPVKACISFYDCMQIDRFCGITSEGLLMRFVLFEGETVRLPKSVSAFMEDGGYKNVPISWVGTYDSNTAGKYSLTMRKSTGYRGGGSARIEIIVNEKTGAN